MQRALRARDAGLRKVSIVTRVLVAGAVVAAGLFTTLAAWAQPGRTTVVGSAGHGAAAAAASSGVGLGDATVNGGALSPPDALPAPDYQYSSPAVVSGAS